MGLDEEINDAENTMVTMAAKVMEELMAISLNIGEIFNPWDYIAFNLAYLLTIYVGGIFGMGGYTDSFTGSILLNSRVYITYMYVQATKKRYIDIVNPANNDTDKR
jgi:hypothetical protein